MTFKEYEKNELLGIIKNAMEYANSAVHKKAQEDKNLELMGTTLEICLIYNNRAYIGHIGDSRIYRIRKEFIRGDCMRCPNCGAFLEQGKVVCNMCGTNSTTYVPEVTNNNFNNDGMFSTGMNTGNGDFSTYNPAINNYKNVSTKKEYHDVELVPVKNGEADIFDFFSSNKKLLTFGGIILLFAVIALAGWKYYDVRSKEPVLEPVFSELYYEVDGGFRDVSTSNGTKLYTKTGDKGSDCSIKINYGASTSDDHVYEYFANIHANLEPEKDTNGKIVNQLDVYTPSEGSMKLNENTWHYINLFFK